MGIEIVWSLMYSVFVIHSMEQDGNSSQSLDELDVWAGEEMTTKPKHRPEPQTESEPEKPKKPRKRRGSLDPAVIVAIVTAVGGIIVAAIALLQSESFLTWFQNRVSPPTPVLPAATAVPYARVQSLDVRRDESVIDQVNPGEILVLAPGSSVVIRVNVIANTEVAGLLFRWEFCHPENNAQGQGAIEIPYTAMMEGQDCVSVKIEKGGVFLDTAHFFVSLE